ncbi:bacilysin biosynthesis protein BacA [Streptomyces sp. G45]|uniref:bacilysin biosynthesis protein BacA n=1 Tax=Streptomyces sp. G45 TaxID=3406627 RepID=UPI003C14FCC6
MVTGEQAHGAARTAAPIAEIRYLHTLGPTGTNLEAAAHLWFRNHGLEDEGHVVLHASLEYAMETVPRTGAHALLACAVYPELHTLVFGHLHDCRMVDSFLWPTHEMVLAAAPDTPGEPRTVATHPAPAGLVPAASERQLVTSNAQAAIDCADGKAEGCVTTVVAARAHGLRIVRSFGEVPMVYTVHHVWERDDRGDGGGEDPHRLPDPHRLLREPRS